MDSPVKSSTHTAIGSVTDSTSYLRGLWIVSSGTAGTLTLTDGAGGSTVMTIATPAAVGGHPIDIPGAGLRFSNGIEIGGAFSNITSATLFYEG